MCSWHGVLLQQSGHERMQLHPQNLCPRVVAVTERRGQDVQSLCDLRGGRGAQRLFDVTHDLLGTWRPIISLQAGGPLGRASHRQAQNVHQELPSCRGHKQAGISLQGEDGVNGTWGRGQGGERRKWGSAGTEPKGEGRYGNSAKWLARPCLPSAQRPGTGVEELPGRLS